MDQSPSMVSVIESGIAAGAPMERRHGNSAFLPTDSGGSGSYSDVAIAATPPPSLHHAVPFQPPQNPIHSHRDAFRLAAGGWNGHGQRVSRERRSCTAWPSPSSRRRSGRRSDGRGAAGSTRSADIAGQGDLPDILRSGAEQRIQATEPRAGTDGCWPGRDNHVAAGLTRALPPFALGRSTQLNRARAFGRHPIPAADPLAPAGRWHCCAGGHTRRPDGSQQHLNSRDRSQSNALPCRP